MVKQLLKYVSVPVLLLSAGIATFLTMVHSWNYELMAMGIFLFTAVYILILERSIPLKPTWKSSRQETIIDTKHLLSTAVFDALGKTFAVWIILSIHSWYAPNIEVWKGLSFIFVFVIANIIGELLPYVYHRISHIGKANYVASLFLWKVHSIHHLPVSLNWFKTNWMHPINMFLNTILKYGVLMLLGFSEEIIFSVGVMHVVIAYLSHANIDARTWLLDYVIVTPKIHQFHHSRNIAEAKNFGNILPFWDMVFGTFYNRKGQVEEVGVVEATYTYPDKNTFLKQWTFPFYARKNCCLSKEMTINKNQK